MDSEIYRLTEQHGGGADECIRNNGLSESPREAESRRKIMSMSNGESLESRKSLCEDWNFDGCNRSSLCLERLRLMACIYVCII